MTEISMTKRWEAKRAGFGRGTKNRSSSYRFYPIALAGLLDQIFLPVCTRAACCARQWSFRCCCCSGCGKLTPRVPAPFRFFLLPSFLSFVFTLPRVVRGKSDFAPIFFLSRGKYFRRKYSLLDSNEFFGEESY